MMNPVEVFSCGTYHPYRYRGEKNPKAGDRLSKAMMDFKDETNFNHKQAVKIFSDLLLKKLKNATYNGKPFTSYKFEVTIVPSHTSGRVSPALVAIALEVCNRNQLGTYVQSLKRNTTVASAHKEGGDRSIANHMSTISVVTNVVGKVVLLIDDVTTTGGSMSACKYLLSDAGATVVLPLSLLETAVYEE